MKNYDKVKKWVYAQIEQWAEHNFESTEDWSQNHKDHELNKAEKLKFIREKKKEFDNL